MMPLFGPCVFFQSSPSLSQSASLTPVDGKVYIDDTCSDTKVHHPTLLCKGYTKAVGQAAAEEADTALAQYQQKDQRRQLEGSLAPGSFAISAGVMPGRMSREDSAPAFDATPDSKQGTASQGQVGGTEC